MVEPGKVLRIVSYQIFLIFPLSKALCPPDRRVIASPPYKGEDGHSQSSTMSTLAHRPLNIFGTYSTCYNHIFQSWELQGGQYINWYQLLNIFSFKNTLQYIFFIDYLHVLLCCFWNPCLATAGPYLKYLWRKMGEASNLWGVGPAFSCSKMSCVVFLL